jgi:TrpR-related protein YerC/YecD
MEVNRSSLPPTRDLSALTDDLCNALLAPADRGEMRRLLLDLCTPAEIRTLAERWHVARLLDDTDLSYRQIHEATGVSTTTIVRVGRFLRQEPNQGYRRTIDALQADNAR